MDKKQDLRVIKTQKALVESMISHLREQPFEDITVKSLCDRAMVRRATFYTHFVDKFELLAFSIRFTYYGFPSYLHLADGLPLSEIYMNLIEDATNWLDNNSEIIEFVKKSTLTPIIISIFSTELVKELLPKIEENINPFTENNISPELVLNFYIQGLIGSLVWWIGEKNHMSKDELVKQLAMLIIKPDMTDNFVR